jgi:hypothetical protein
MKKEEEEKPKVKAESTDNISAPTGKLIKTLIS